MAKADVSAAVLVEEVFAAAESFACRVTDETARRLAAFAELLLRWNARINLTGARTGEELLREHFPDSFALAGLLPPSVGLVDVGSGGGLPALPLALLRPDVALTLVEPRAKRVAFLRTAVRELGIKAAVVSGRAEDVGTRFDVASSRATFAPSDWLGVGREMVRPGGEVVFLVHDVAELPFGPAAEHRTVHYKAGLQNRVAAALRLPPS